MTHAPAPLVIAHRGASGYRPEHSRAAFELAIALGADALEPDLVPTKDGVLVIRHENEISGTTDVESRPEFAHLRTTKTVDTHTHTGWFTEDFTWAELSTLRVTERLPKVRQTNTTFDGTQPILRLSDLREIIEKSSSSPVMVAELKHASYFASIGLPLDELFAAEVKSWATDDNLVMESFEETVLHQARERGVPGKTIYLIEDGHLPADVIAREGSIDPERVDQLTDASIARLAGVVDGISVAKGLLLDKNSDGETIGSTDVVERAHAAGLLAFSWTLRPENCFLMGTFQDSVKAREWGDWRAEFELILATGVDGVFADHPDLIVSLLTESR